MMSEMSLNEEQRRENTTIDGEFSEFLSNRMINNSLIEINKW